MRRTAAVILGTACLLGLTAATATAAPSTPGTSTTASAPVDSCNVGPCESVFNFNMDSHVNGWVWH